MEPLQMPNTYSDIMREIESLTREAERLKRKEAQGVISRIREAIDQYGLTAEDLGLSSGKPRGRVPAPKGAVRTRSKLSDTAKFRDDSGNTWVGRGPRPRWLREALASGKQLSDFEV